MKLEEDGSVTEIELSYFISFVSFNTKINNNLYINFFLYIKKIVELIRYFSDKFIYFIL